MMLNFLPLFTAEHVQGHRQAGHTGLSFGLGPYELS